MKQIIPTIAIVVGLLLAPMAFACEVSNVSGTALQYSSCPQDVENFMNRLQKICKDDRDMAACKRMAYEKNTLIKKHKKDLSVAEAINGYWDEAHIDD